VEAVGDGTTALEVARAWAPDLILTDVMMPGLDGFALLRAVRDDPRTRSISVILLSARADDESRMEGLRAGADDYLVKPVSAVELLARIDGQLALLQLRGEARATEERQRVARDLHDSVVQTLYSLVLLAYAARRDVQSAQRTQVEVSLDQIYEMAQQAQRELRLLVYQLRPGVLTQDGLVQALERRLDAVERRAGVAAHLLVEGDLALPAPAVDAFYSIAQEALTNALKHAAPTEVSVRLACSGDTATMIVSDNGRSIDLAAMTAGGGLGLESMRERAESIGASFAIEPVCAGGTRVSVALRFHDTLAAIDLPRETQPLASGGGI
jgi:signal transduction histidine kinase